MSKKQSNQHQSIFGHLLANIWMALTYLGYGGLSAAVAAIAYANLPTRLTLGAVVPTVDYLAKGRLTPIDKSGHANFDKTFLAGDIFKQSPVLLMVVRRPGCLFCRKEAKFLSSLKQRLDAKQIRLVGAVHETRGVNEFRPFLNGDVFFDAEKHFYGPKQRWLPIWVGFLRLSTYIEAVKTMRANVKGNMQGEGRLLGGVYMVKNNEMVFAHLESEWGDDVNHQALIEAIDKL